MAAQAVAGPFDLDDDGVVYSQGCQYRSGGRAMSPASRVSCLQVYPLPQAPPVRSLLLGSIRPNGCAKEARHLSDRHRCSHQKVVCRRNPGGLSQPMLGSRCHPQIQRSHLRRCLRDRRTAGGATPKRKQSGRCVSSISTPV